MLMNWLCRVRPAQVLSVTISRVLICTPGEIGGYATAPKMVTTTEQQIRHFSIGGNAAGKRRRDSGRVTLILGKCCGQWVIIKLPG
ncbi:hypothetical protein KCP77_11900 [Salmonella enterica subsp. enterica]|nr:hypothetical protein KCP77_11900 [Salmonella enterica subsp. enterica]